VPPMFIMIQGLHYKAVTDLDWRKVPQDKLIIFKTFYYEIK
jgi:hypothetical protein